MFDTSVKQALTRQSVKQTQISFDSTIRWMQKMLKTKIYHIFYNLISVASHLEFLRSKLCVVNHLCLSIPSDDTILWLKDQIPAKIAVLLKYRPVNCYVPKIPSKIPTPS